MNTPFRWGMKYNDAREPEKRLKCILDDIGKHRVSEHPAAMDLGANTGYFSYGLADAGFDVTAVEAPNNHVYNPEVLSEHRRWVHAPEDLPDGPFDVSLVMSVLHHIPSWKSVLNGVMSRTRSLVYVEVPHSEEQHPMWHGSRESLDYLSSLPHATVIGEHFESAGRLKRPLFRVEL